MMGETVFIGSVFDKKAHLQPRDRTYAWLLSLSYRKRERRYYDPVNKFSLWNAQINPRIPGFQ